MTDLCSIIVNSISSKDILNIIVEFRSEMYIQEILSDCETAYGDYERIHKEITTLYHHYDTFIYQSFRPILESDKRKDFQLLDLMHTFRKLNGPHQEHFKALQHNYIQTKQKVDLALDDNLLIFYIESIACFRQNNKTPANRKLISREIVSFIKAMIDSETRPLIESVEHIKTHCKIRLEILQYVVKWVYSHTVESWSFWFKSFINKPTHIYYSLVEKKSEVDKFLKLKFD
jgi:hypothetical protein